MTIPTVPASVIVRTIGEAPQLRACLQSLADCRPRAAEVVIVDQSRGEHVAALAAGHAAANMRVVRSERRGRALAANVGLHAARFPTVLSTDDDCTVDPRWVGIATAMVQGEPGLLVTGSIHASGDPRAIPSHREYPLGIDFSGNLRDVDVCAANLACDRQVALDLGGFDEGMEPAMEDWDFAYRWVKRGLPVRYAPGLKVDHHDWREPSEIEQVWRQYGIGCGLFYAKLIRAGDPTVLVFLTRDVKGGLRGVIARMFYGHRWWDLRIGVWRGIPSGFAAGMRRGRRR
jgi:GT2 family glycosyltransferase